MPDHRQSIADILRTLFGVLVRCQVPTLPYKASDLSKRAGGRSTKGYRCKCGFKTTAMRLRCPRCDKHMMLAYWPNQGTVLVYVKLGVVPVEYDFPMDLLMLEIKNGPKVVCWTDTVFSVGDEVTFVQLGDTYICSPRCDIKEVLTVPEDSEDDGGEPDEGELGSEP